MMARAKRIYISMIKVNKQFSFFIMLFSKKVENMFSLFLLNYRDTGESLGELEKAVETLACGNTFLVLPNFYLCFYNSVETWYMFSISEILLSLMVIDW